MAVTRRGNRWQARAYSKGQRTYLGSFPTKDEAQLAVLQFKQDRVYGQEPCGRFADRWLRDFNYAGTRWDESTLRLYRQGLKAFKARFGDERLRHLDLPTVRAWARSRPESETKMLSVMFNDAKGDGLVDRNPFEKLRRQTSQGRRRIVALTEPELEKLCDTALEVHGKWGSTYAAILSVLGYVGLRPAELCALTHEDLDGQTLHVRAQFNGHEMKPPKNKQPRSVYVPAPVLERLQVMPRRINSPWLFTQKAGYRHHGRLSPQNLRYAWQKVEARFHAGLPSERQQELLTARKGKAMDLYELRHAAATILLRRGASPEEAAWQLGHEGGDKLIRRVYGHLEADYKVDRVSAYWTEAPKLRVVKDESEAANG